MTRVGLVLGAGGTVGQAYHAGVLAALEHDLGWDPRTAELIVGTSAGAITGALLRLGIPAHDLAAWAVQAPLSVEGTRLRSWFGQCHPEFPPLDARHLLRPWRLPRPALLKRLLRGPWTMRPSAALMTMLPAGMVELRRHTDPIGEDAAAEWPEGLWVCATRRDDVVRVVFGRECSPRAPLGDTLAASCSIPAYFAPVEIEGREYFDGGVHSATNADLLREADLDLVIVVSPMSGRFGTAPRWDQPLRALARRRLLREIGSLDGVPSVCFEPGPGSLAAMGTELMTTDGLGPVVQEAFVEGGAQAAREAHRGRLAPLHLRRNGALQLASPRS